MKLSGLALLAGIALGGLASAPIAADVVVHKTVRTNHTVSHNGHAWHRHKVCHTSWVHHRKVTHCSWS